MAIIKCPECAKEVSDKAAACIGCGAPIAQLVVQHEAQNPISINFDHSCEQGANPSGMFCERCLSNNVIVSTVAMQKERGCLMVCLWIFLAICTVGLILLLIPLLMKKGDKAITYATCQNCGHRWQI